MISLKKISSVSSKGFRSQLKSQVPLIGGFVSIQKRDASSQDHLMKYGAGGRNSFNGNVVTVFGGTGFLGRYVINRLAKVGTQIVVPYHGSEDDIRFIRLMGDLGQIVFMNYSINDYDSIVKTLSHSTAAVNLLGRDYSNRNFQMEDSLVFAAEKIAKASSESGVKRLVHVSHLNANLESSSEFMQLKAKGEAAVKDIFPDVSVMRPAQAYGFEDKYLNKFAYLSKLSVVPLVGGGWTTTKKPVYITDIAQAVVAASLDDALIGKTFELYGPEEYYLHDMIDYTMRIIRKKWTSVPVPMQFCKLMGWIGEQSIFSPRLTRDLVEREFLSDLTSDDAYTFADIGIDPVNLNDAALSVLRRHRHYYHFDEMKTDEDVIRPVAA